MNIYRSTLPQLLWQPVKSKRYTKSDNLGDISEEEIVEILKKKGLDTPPVLSKLTAIVQALWALEIVKDNTDVHRITAKAISYILLRIAEIPLPEAAIPKAFARAGNKIARESSNGKIFYEIMGEGRKALKNKIGEIGKDQIQFFSGKTPWSDFNKNFPKIISMLVGEICIVDPYYGNGTLLTLEKFGKVKKIRFLTSQLGTAEQNTISKFNAELKRFKAEFNNIAIRKYADVGELHDRYIISDNAIVVIGHGIKDIGTKESFCIFIPKAAVGNFLPNLKNTFEKRWAASTAI